MTRIRSILVGSTPISGGARLPRPAGLRLVKPLATLLGVSALIFLLAACKGGSDSTAAPTDEKLAQNPAGDAGSVDPAAPPAESPALPPPAHSSTGEAAAPGTSPVPATPGEASLPGMPITPSGPPTQVVAKVNGQAITRGELDFMVKNVMQDKAGSVPVDQHADIRRRVLDDLINKELLYQKASSSNVTVTPAELSDTLSKIKSDFPSEEAFNEQLRKDGMTLAAIETMLRQGMVIDKYLSTSVKPNVKVLPAEEEKFYQENKEKMKHPEQLRASHILLRTDRGASEDVKKTQKTKAEEALGRAKKGEDFAALAKQYSQDPQTAPNGGDLGFFAKGQMVPSFDAAAWTLKEGEISGIVETNFGYHIIKAVERRPEGYAPIDDVRARIHEFLVNQHVQQDTKKAIDGLKAKAKIELTL